MSKISVRRHQYLLAPNEGVVTTPDLAVLAERTEEFMGDTGLNEQDLIVTPVVSIPLPLTLLDEGVRVRPQVSPDMMWHPLFWLPLDVGLRRMIPGDTESSAEGRPESDAEWAIRVMSMVGAAGLFDAESGTWVDVLSMAALNSDDDAVGERVAVWQAGGSDSDLDGIDLTELFALDDVEEAGNSALELSPDIVAAQYALSADDIGGSIAGALDDLSLDAEDHKAAAYLYLVQAHHAMFDNPDVESIPGVQSRIVELIQQVQAQDAGGGEVDGAGVLKELRAIMAQVYLTFEPFLAVMRALAGEQEADQEAAPTVSAAPAPFTPPGGEDWGAEPPPAPAPMERGELTGW